MELRQLRYFIAIVEQGSFSRAASELGRTQQALSKAIQALEDELGVRLLDRNSLVASPTAFGKLLLEHSRAIESETYSFRAKVAHLLDAEAGVVRLGTGASVAGGVVARAVLGLQRTRPLIRLDVVSGVHTEFVAQLKQDQIDLAVCIETSNLDLGNLVRETIEEDEYVVVCGSSHPLAQKREVSVVDLSRARWIFGRRLGEIESAWTALFDEAGLARPQTGIETNSLEFCRAALFTGEYLTLMTRSLVGDDLRSGSMRALAISQATWRRPIVLLYRRSEIDTPATLAVINALYSAVRGCDEQGRQENMDQHAEQFP
jgi:LysR family nitrogen assimilation transcriptional regulator